MKSEKNIVGNDRKIQIDGQTHGAPYCGNGCVPLRCIEGLVMRTGTQQQMQIPRTITLIQAIIFVLINVQFVPMFLVGTLTERHGLAGPFENPGSYRVMIDNRYYII